jgi:hypothetical protein
MGGIERLLSFYDMGRDSSDDDESSEDYNYDDEYIEEDREGALIFIFLILIEVWYGEGF